MTQNDQMLFVYQLSNSIIHELIQQIIRGNIPREWDGIELRELLAEKFARETHHELMRGKRKKDYNNAVIVNNL